MGYQLFWNMLWTFYEMSLEFRKCFRFIVKGSIVFFNTVLRNICVSRFVLVLLLWDKVLVSYPLSFQWMTFIAFVCYVTKLSTLVHWLDFLVCIFRRRTMYDVHESYNLNISRYLNNYYSKLNWSLVLCWKLNYTQLRSIDYV